MQESRFTQTSQIQTLMRTTWTKTQQSGTGQLKSSSDGCCLIAGAARTQTSLDLS